MKILILFGFLFCGIGASGQCTNCIAKPGTTRFCWGDKKDSAQVIMAAFLDGWHSKEYERDAAAQFKNMDWLLENAPCLNVSLYQSIEEFIAEISSKEKSKRKLRMYAMKMKDVAALKSKYFPAE